MAMTYTSDDFLKALDNAGFSRENFSDADWDMSMKNPTFGMSMISYKKDYANAGTEEGRALANESANRLRRSYGGYSGGEDGGSFQLNTKRQTQIDALLDDMTNYGSFSYDPESDPVYGSYKKAYRREGDRAAKNALGVAASATGGRPSSYAVTAASQANDYYASKLADVIPQLYEQAYNRYLAEFNRKRALLGDLEGAEQTEYGRYADDLSRRRQERLDEEARKQQAYADAYNRANLFGTVSDADAEILGIPAGTYTADEAYRRGVLDREDEERDYSRAWNEEERDYNRNWAKDERDYQRGRDAVADGQRRFDNAATVWNLSGYAPENGADALGVPAGTPTETLVQAGMKNYTRGSSSSNGGGGGGGDTPKKQAMTADEALTAFWNGDSSDEVLAVLISEYGEEAVNDAIAERDGSQTPQATPKGDRTQMDFHDREEEIRWNGKVYRSMTELVRDLNAAGLTSEERRIIENKLNAHGYRLS